MAGARTCAVWMGVVVAVGLVGVGATGAHGADESAVTNRQPLYKDAAAPIEQRVADLLAQMTPTEMVGQLLHPWTVGNDFSNLQNLTRTWGGVGAAYTFWLQNGGACAPLNLTCNAVQQNLLQSWVVQNSRLGIPISIVQETLHGAVGGGTIFPMPCSMGATWNAPLIQQVGSVIGLEARVVGIDRGFSPELNLATDPRFGRTEENFGEDPMLVSTLGAAMTVGMQGNTDGPSSYLDSDHIACEAKHAVAYGYYGLDWGPADIGLALYDVYLKPWRAFGRVGGRGLMASHNSVDGMPNHANGPVLTGILRETFNLSLALFASDDGDVPELVNYHIASNLSQAAVLAVSAGVDQELNIGAYPSLVQSLAQGAVNLSALQRAAGNVLREKFAAGLFDSQLLVNVSRLSIVGNATSRALARQVAREGIVLLRNEGGLLPLSTTGLHTVAVIGPNGGCPPNVTSCNATNAQLGGYTNYGAPVVTVYDAVANTSGIAAQWLRGADIDDLDTSGIPAAVAAAKQSELVVVVVGDSSDGYGKGSCAEGTDRASLDLPGSQLPLLAALADATANGTNPPMVVVLVNGRPATFGADAWSQFGPYNALLSRLPAVLVAWRPGQEGGNAIWDVITGAYNPSGRLAQTWPAFVGQIKHFTPWYLQWTIPSWRSYSLGVSSAPLFPFGYGLSYTSVNPTAISLSPATVAPGQTFNATVTLSSSGPAVDFVVQVYFSQNIARLARYSKMLAGFTKVTLPANAQGFTATVPISADELAYWDPEVGDYVLDNGIFTISTGHNSANTPVSAQLTVVGGRSLP
jgi:beta-glucosidase